MARKYPAGAARRRPLRLLSTIVCLPILLSSISPAQQTPAGSPPPFSCADTTRRYLGSFVGDYDVSAVFRRGQEGWDSTGARASFSYELGGCAVREHFEGTRYGQPYAYVAIWGANGDSAQKIQRTFLHSQHGILSLSDGGWASTDTLVLLDSAFVRGRWIQQRVVISRPAADGFVLEGRRSEDGGRTWFVTQRSRYVPRRTD
jgi:hypothetical protein